jgi:hypothetical protein
VSPFVFIFLDSLFPDQPFAQCNALHNSLSQRVFLITELSVAARSCFDKRDEAKRKLCKNEVLGFDWNPSNDPVMCNPAA